MAISSSTDRFNGVVASQAIKVPCTAVSIANLTLSGEQTVNGVAVVADDRVLVNAQTIGSENGIYDVATSAWTRSADWDGNRDVVRGTLVTVHASTGQDFFYQLTTADPIIIGTTAVALTLTNDPNVSIPITADEIAAGLTAGDINSGLRPGEVQRYGANTTPDTTDMTTPVQRAIDVAEINNGHVYFDEPDIYLGNWTINASITIHASDGVILKGSTASAVVLCTADFVNVVGGLKIDGDSTSLYCWHHQHANNGNFDSLWLTGATSHGLFIQGQDTNRGAYYNSWHNLVSKTNGGDGVKIDGTNTPDHRANVNNFFGGQVSSNTGDGFDLENCAGTGIHGTSIETNTGFAIRFTDCVIAALTMNGGWIESNTAGGVSIDATTLMVQLYGTRFNQATEFTGAGVGNSGNIFMVDSAAGVLTRWMQTIGQNLQSPYIITPQQHTRRVAASKTANYNIEVLDSGQTFNNAGAGGIITGTLPVAAVGLWYLFSRNNAGNAHRIDPDGTEVIRDGSSGGVAEKYLSLDTNFGTVTLQCVVAGAWEVIASNSGTISFEA